VINRSIFREYDIRGIVGSDLNKQSVKLIGYFFGKKIGGQRVVSVGFDARDHSQELRDCLVSGLNRAGCTVLDMGMVATPVSYFSNYQTLDRLIPSTISHLLTINKYPDASIMITGSHNPKEYNGFKITLNRVPFFGDDIYTLGDEIINNQNLEIEDNLEKIDIDVKNLYVEYMLDKFKELKGLDLKIVADCGNGVAGVVIEDIFKGLELNVKALYCKPDGSFPNHHPDPSVEENLKDVKRALNEDGDIAFAYDGDADRIAVITKKNNIKGDQLALLYTLIMDKPTVVGEVKCSKIMYDELARRGAKVAMYKTGHSNLKVKMKEINADLACEVSGHIFFKDRYFGFDDAIYATLRVLELINRGIDLDQELEKLPKLYSTDELKVKTTDEKKFKIIENIKEILNNLPEDFPKIVDVIDIDGLRINFEHGWGLVRASNTTPILVTRFEAESEELVKLYENRVNWLIEASS